MGFHFDVGCGDRESSYERKIRTGVTKRKTQERVNGKTATLFS